jgi:hypothetical protein
MEDNVRKDNLKKTYDKIQLNFGIKTFFEKKTYKLKLFIDHKIIYPLYKKIEKYIFNEVINHYGADYKWNDQKSQNIDKKTSNYGYGLFHYSMIKNQKPKKVLCVGSMYGFIPYMMAKACEENGVGKVDFVDAGFDLKDSDDKETHYFGHGFWKKETAKKHFSYLLNPKYINTHIMTTKEFAKKYKKNKYDYICLDGDHSYAGATLDMKLFWPKLNKEGFVSFHDIHLEKNFLKKEARDMDLELGYKKIWQELIKTKKFKFELSNHYSGLGFLQKL